MKGWGKWCFLISVFVGVGLYCVPVKARTIYDSPYVTFSPDGQAWTTNAGDQNYVWYASDGSQDVVTGLSSSLKLEPGKHYYEVRRTGRVPLSKWVVDWSNVNCCHNAYPKGTEYHGVEYVKETCLKPHYSGWRGICADCGKRIETGFVYMSRAAAQSIDYMEIDKAYYYLCPFNRNLEQGIQIRWHTCRALSANQYRVEYLPNTKGETYNGYMEPSFHMYDNAVSYEGRTVIPQKRLSKNCYSRIGWKFAGWNTMPDGSGVFYEDAAEIRNLSTEDYEADNELGNVKLYAVWKRVSGVLEIDPSGGTYMGNSKITTLTRDYGSSYEINTSMLKAPKGYTVSFETRGGGTLAPITGTTHFVNWEQISPFGGELSGNRYVFSAPNNNVDRIAARYEYDAIILPQPVKTNSSFGGWYYDAQFTKPAGTAGDQIVPTQDMTLYAQWVELVLKAEENYTACKGAGAVDLSWFQNDGQDKIYKTYQSMTGEDWKQIYRESDIGNRVTVNEQYAYSGQKKTYTVPYTGYYELTASGAQGGDYKSYSGGAGGKVTGSFWLKKGEVLTVCVGGKNGYNGGGTGSSYGNGGGCTTVNSNLQGLLMTAGGGGGAAPNGSGYAGGLAQSLVASGMTGGSGAVGGGGGYRGGKAGELIVHNHVEGVCNHIHKGNSTKSGGCYTVPVTCGRTLKHVYAYTRYWSWGGNDTEYCPNCGATASRGETCPGHSMDQYDHECPVHGNRVNNDSSDEPKKCDAVDHYAVSCGKTEAYTCGYPYNGYVVSSKAAYGGSSYINTSSARNYTLTPGVQRGNGAFQLVSKDIGYQSGSRLNAVESLDRQAPDEISPESVRKTPIDERTILVKWEKPQDYGTVYYHMAESYRIGTSQKICTSNITKNTLISGIKGYYYCLDDKIGTKVQGKSDKFISAAQLSVSIGETDRYLHICPVDVAGNLGATTHILIGGRSGGDAEVAWQVCTEPLWLRESENVYAGSGEKSYYVKCDGTTPFVIGFGAYLKGNAAESYQVNQAVIESADATGKKVNHTVYVPRCGITDESITLLSEQLETAADAPGLLHGAQNVTAVRSDRNKKLTVTQEFVPDEGLNGVELTLTPRAAAEWKKELICSDYTADLKNGLRIIGDGTAPEIHGLEGLKEIVLVDRRDGDRLLQVFAEDALSGVKEFYMEVQNQDNGALQEYQPDANGLIAVNITEDVPIFSGDFTVTIYACDNVGNERIERYGATEFDLQVDIERILEPHVPVFKQGESGNLIITTWGYAERVEVEFPQALAELDPSLNRVYIYELKQHYKQQEQYSFMIPLYAPDADQYTVTVRAYKGDKMLEEHPGLQIMTVEGTVLDEIRTRLR